MKKLESNNKRVKQQLSLKRETILLLSRTQMQQVAAGVSADTTCSSGHILCTED